MDPHPGSFPILSYVLSRIPTFGPKTAAASSSHSDLVNIDIEQHQVPYPRSPSGPSSSVSSSGLTQPEILGQMPHLADSKLLASMTRAISDVSQTRSILKLIGERPDHENVDNAKMKLADIDAQLSRQLEEIVLSQRPANVDVHQWRSYLAEKEKECREWADKKKRVYKSVVQLDQMHDAYETLLKDAEKRLVKIYESAEEGAKANDDDSPMEEINEEVVGILQEAHGQGMEIVDLSNRKLKFLPEEFGRIPGLLVLDLSCNHLEVIPDSIAGLHNLEEFNVASNLLESLPDSIGLLQKLKVLNVSGNKLTVLPDSICQCRSLVELDASFNSLLYLPTNIGYELVNLRKLLIQLNKIRSLPSSFCEMRSLQCLDAHFNELQGLPIAIGKLINLEVLNLSSNFADLKELPETFGDLKNLRELDLSNNQINALPDTFGSLDKLTKLNLEQNPLELPPSDIVNEGVEAVKTFMARRWIDILIEEERKSAHSVQEQGQTGWLTRSTSWLKNVSESVTEVMGSLISSPRSPKDAYLDQQL